MVERKLPGTSHRSDWRCPGDAAGLSDQPPITELRAFPHVMEPREELSLAKEPDSLSVLLDCDWQSLAQHSLLGEKTTAGMGLDLKGSGSLRRAGGW